MKVLNAEQIRRVEKRGNELGVSYENMMKTAGTSAARLILKQLGDEKRISVVCGKGKNGGDGYVAADFFAAQLYYKVTIIFAAGEPVDEISRLMLKRALERGVNIIDWQNETEAAKNTITGSDIIIDAIFGIGFSGDVKDDILDVIRTINASDAKVFSLDIPSGLECDSQTPFVNHIKADYTVTMFAPKPALVLKPSSYECGKILVADIGVPDECMEGADFLFEVNSLDEIARDFPPRPYDSHKGSFGHALLICGSRNMPGAAVFAARAAVECGAGLVTAAFPDAAYPAIASKLNEPLMLPLESSESGTFSPKAVKKLLEAAEKASVILIGCGLGIDNGNAELVRAIIKYIKCPLIIDADGINIVSRNINVLKEAGRQLILTPHPGEMSRLCGLSTDEINADRLNIAAGFAREWGVNLVLKGANTIIASPEGDCVVNTTGCPAMARGGSGDVLAGMIAAFTAQGLTPLRACADAVYLHGAAGEKAAAAYSQLGATPSRLLDSLPALFNMIDKKW